MAKLVDIESEEFWQILFDEACVEGKQAERIEKELNKIADNGWILYSEEKPKKNGWYWGYYVTSSYIDINGVKHEECKYGSIYWEDNLWLYDPRGFRTVDIVVAWKPIAPYQPKNSK